MSRPLTFLAILQAFLVVVGFLALGIVLKLCGYPDAFAMRWNPLAVFLREYGPWLLLLPVLWTLFATAAERKDRGILSVKVAHLIGMLFAVVIIALYLYACAFPYTRALLIHWP
jgi:hypothetical protein